MSEWYLLAIKRGYTLVRPSMSNFLSKVGRLKYLEIIYQALMDSPYESDQQFAREVFKQAEKNYHPISRQAISSIVSK